MKMKIIALLGSPRKGGNTETLADAFLEGAKSKDAVVEKIRLNKLRIRGCQACLACHKAGKCAQKDDMKKVYKKMLKADVWLFVSPVYWWGPTAQIKAAIDRMYCFAFGNNPKKIEGKKAVLITACADEVELATPYLFGMMKESTSFLKMEWAGEIAVKAWKKGEAAQNKQALQKARKLGVKVASL